MNQRITYEQVQRAIQTMPDLVDVIRMLEPKLAQMAASGVMARFDLCRPDYVGVHWDRGN